MKAIDEKPRWWVINAAVRGTTVHIGRCLAKKGDLIEALGHHPLIEGNHVTVIQRPPKEKKS